MVCFGMWHTSYLKVKVLPPEWKHRACNFPWRMKCHTQTHISPMGTPIWLYKSHDLGFASFLFPTHPSIYPLGCILPPSILDQCPDKSISLISVKFLIDYISVVTSCIEELSFDCKNKSEHMPKIEQMQVHICSKKVIIQYHLKKLNFN